MYIQQKFRETDPATLHALMRANPLGALVVMTPAGLEANHMPFQLSLSPQGELSLRAHIPIGNSLWQQPASGDTDALVIFQGPQSYITPSWYPSKQVHGQAVPTWNYAVVHASGCLRFIRDKVWLLEHVTALTNQHEAPQALPWQVSDAPADYLQSMLDKIVGIEIAVTTLQGKWKVSQNRPSPDRLGVVAGLETQGSEQGRAMAALVRQHIDS